MPSPLRLRLALFLALAGPALLACLSSSPTSPAPDGGSSASNDAGASFDAAPATDANPASEAAPLGDAGDASSPNSTVTFLLNGTSYTDTHVSIGPIGASGFGIGDDVLGDPLSVILKWTDGTTGPTPCTFETISYGLVSAQWTCFYSSASSCSVNITSVGNPVVGSITANLTPNVSQSAPDAGCLDPSTLSASFSLPRQ